MQNSDSTLHILMARFKGQLLIPFVPASITLGLAQQTARNRLAKGTFPVATIVENNRRYIHICDLANFIDSLRGQNLVIPEIKPVRKGRPPNSEKYKLQRGV